MRAARMLPVPYALATWLVQKRLQGVARSKYDGAGGLPSSGTRQPEVPSQDIGAELPLIWRMMSSGSVPSPSAAEEVWPDVQAEVRFSVIEANLDPDPKRSSR